MTKTYVYFFVYFLVSFGNLTQHNHQQITRTAGTQRVSWTQFLSLSDFIHNLAFFISIEPGHREAAPTQSELERTSVFPYWSPPPLKPCIKPCQACSLFLSILLRNININTPLPVHWKQNLTIFFDWKLNRVNHNTVCISSGLCNKPITLYAIIEK